MKASKKATAKTFISHDEALTTGNDGQNQKIKGILIEREVYCNVGNMVEKLLSHAESSGDPLFTWDDVSNLYSYPEWSGKVVGEDLYFGGGSESDKDTFLEEFTRLEDESAELLEKEEISEETHERNLELIDEAREEFKTATEDQESAEIFEWWAVSNWFAEKLEGYGQSIIDAGSVKVWGRRTTGQAILLDYVITCIAADMGILEGQENSWANKG